MKENESAPLSRIPGWSWLVSAIGLVLVVGTVGFMLYPATLDQPSPPDLVVEIAGIVVNESGHLVEMRVKNLG